MPRGFKKDTLQRCIDARLASPYNLGPILGEAAVRAGIPPSAMGELIGVTHSTVFRWFFGQSRPHASYADKIGRCLAFLTWGLDRGLLPAEGTKQQRMKAIRQVIVAFREEKAEIDLATKATV
jgi:hypothetical protein